MKCFYLSVKSETLRLQKYCNSEKKIKLILPLNLWEKKQKQFLPLKCCLSRKCGGVSLMSQQKQYLSPLNENKNSIPCSIA